MLIPRDYACKLCSKFETCNGEYFYAAFAAYGWFALTFRLGQTIKCLFDNIHQLPSLMSHGL